MQGYPFSQGEKPRFTHSLHCDAGRLGERDGDGEGSALHPAPPGSTTALMGPGCVPSAKPHGRLTEKEKEHPAG